MRRHLAGKQARGGMSWGAVFVGAGEVSFRNWAPGQEGLRLRLGEKDLPMLAVGDGWFELRVPNVALGTPYAFVLADGLTVPDPASRGQQGDVHGSSLVTDPNTYAWQNTAWEGKPWEEAVIYELHVGTFTPEGTFAAASERLAHLAALGVTAVELMPVAQFSGNRGWGYDGVLLYAPHRAYGTPDEMKAFIDAAHGHGLMVLLDVVYNHFGPDGNYLPRLAPSFFNEDEQTPWGPAIAYGQEPVRRYAIENALYWLGEFQLDGLRLDAIDQIRDASSATHVLIELAREVRKAWPDRHIHLTTEDNRNITALHERDAEGGVVRYTAEWNDDFHNAVHCIATGENEGYYAAFSEQALPKLIRSLAEGFTFQGDARWGDDRGGKSSAHLPPTAFIDFLQNHDQTGNRALGERLTLLANPAMLRALSAILMLSPHIPMLFMGEEYGEVRPFFFFTDFHGDLANAVRNGRRREFADFAAFRDGTAIDEIPDPNAMETFQASKLDWGRAETTEGHAALEITRNLLALRRRHIVPLLTEAGGHGGTVLKAREGVVAIDWQLGGSLLSLRANLSTRSTACPPLQGQALYAEPSQVADVLVAEGDLPPLCAVFGIAATGGDR